MLSAGLRGNVCTVLIEIGTCLLSVSALLQQLGSQPIFNPSMMPHWSRDHKAGQEALVFVFTVQNNHRCETLAERKKNLDAKRN